MNKEQKMQIEEFINKNGLQFTVGRRNSDSTIISGFASFVGVENYHKVFEIITKRVPEFEAYKGEFFTTFNYAKRNSYGNFWTTKAAKKQYTF